MIISRSEKVVIAIIIIFLLAYWTNFYSAKNRAVSVKKSYERCLEKGTTEREKGTCFRKLANTLYSDYSIKEIESGLQKIDDKKKLIWCHEFMHYLGWELYDDKNDISIAFREASDMCDSAMYHGVVEEYVNKRDLAQNLTGAIGAIINEACENGKMNDLGTTRGMRSHCYHGLGHGFMFITSNNLPISLNYCDQIDTEFRRSCYTGAFMENNQSKQVGRDSLHVSEFFRPDDPDYPCRILNEQHKDTCYFYKGTNNLNKKRGDLKRAVEECLKGIPKYQESCFKGIGANTPGHYRSPLESAIACKTAISADKRAYKQCIIGAMSFIVQLNHGSAEAASEFCEATEDSHKDICYRTAGADLTDWVTPADNIENKCAKFKSEHARTLCLNLSL